MLANVAEHLTRMALERPDALAIVAHDGRGSRARLTYRALEDDARAVARGLAGLGLARGTRAVLMVPPSLDLFRLVFGFFHAGVVPVMVDPGMGTASLETCLARAQPDGFIGIPKAHAARIALGWAPEAKVRVVVGAGELVSRALGGASLASALAHGEAVTGSTEAEDVAAILFTSGSTGVPKGAVYQHRNFNAQVEAIRSEYDIRPGEIDLPTFPLFALFDPALGMTTVLPDMDPTRPASVDPRRIAAAVEDFRPTNLFGSPALLDTVSRWAAPRGHVFGSIERVISAGAPVAPKILARMSRCLPPSARIHTPYGATESLPIASIDHSEILRETGARMGEGAGICVGRPVPSAEVVVMKVDDGPVEDWDEALRVPDGSVGEIAVSGPQVTERYFGQDDETRRHKLLKDGRLFHRTGDVGYLDGAGRLWYCGRKAQRVVTEDGTLYTERVEGPFNAHPEVKRAALVGVKRGGRTLVVVCIEPDDRTLDARGRAALGERLSGLVAGVDRVLVAKDPFPVDIRHNAKIGREKLAAWAATVLEA